MPNKGIRELGDRLGQNYIEDGVPTNTFFKQDGTTTSVIKLKTEVKG